jgi:lysophospholipase L1-like esterase
VSEVVGPVFFVLFAGLSWFLSSSSCPAAAPRRAKRRRVILIGDSIRIGYQDTVRAALGDVADVDWPAENGGNTRNVLAHLEEWAISQRADLVHVNCGLHDLRVMRGASDNVVPLAEYAANVERILTAVRDRAGARVAWAATTPINEVWHRSAVDWTRSEADVVRYNAAAAGVCRRLGVPVDDLYQVALDAGRDAILAADGVHFRPEGYRLLGQAAARFLRAALR